MSFELNTRQDLKELINSTQFTKLEISKAFADDLIKKCLEYELFDEIEKVKFITIQTSSGLNLKEN